MTVSALSVYTLCVSALSVSALNISALSVSAMSISALSVSALNLGLTLTNLTCAFVSMRTRLPPPPPRHIYELGIKDLGEIRIGEGSSLSSTVWGIFKHGPIKSNVNPSWRSEEEFSCDIGDGDVIQN